MLSKYLSLVKFAHTLFALPFALVGFFLGTIEVGGFDWRLFLLVLACMVTARNAAMAFNRYLDRNIDAKNARTQIREIPSGKISANSALIFVLINCAGFITATAFINLYCLFLSPVALIVILGYSFTKRFTALCHLVLGLGLSLAPIGAYLAVTGKFSTETIILGACILTWVSGFDIIYALQDEEFDKTQKLHSIPVFMGKKNALILSTFLHLITASGIILFSWLNGGHWMAWTGTSIFIILLIYQHLIVSPKDLSRVNLAFFTTNGIASVLFSGFFIIEIFLK